MSWFKKVMEVAKNVNTKLDEVCASVEMKVAGRPLDEAISEKASSMVRRTKEKVAPMCAAMKKTSTTEKVLLGTLVACSVASGCVGIPAIGIPSMSAGSAVLGTTVGLATGVPTAMSIMNRKEKDNA